jgi:hypothetical protein
MFDAWCEFVSITEKAQLVGCAGVLLELKIWLLKILG